MEVTIDDITFNLLNKFMAADRWLIEIESRFTSSTGELVVTEFTVYRSSSECGVCRLCMVFPHSPFVKGIDYTLTTVIHTDLQLFINEHFDSISVQTPHVSIFNHGQPFIDDSYSITLKNAMHVYNEDIENIDSPSRRIFIVENTVDYIPDTIELLGDYNYSFSLPNYNLVPINKNDEDSFRIDTSVTFGFSHINIKGKYFSVEFTTTKYSAPKLFSTGPLTTPQEETFILDYMVCDVDVEIEIEREMPYDLTEIHEKNVIIPLMIRPKEVEASEPESNSLKKYGLYNTYCAFHEYSGGYLKFSKILEYYTGNGRDKRKRCTSDYVYNADEYKNFDFIVKLQEILLDRSTTIPFSPGSAHTEVKSSGKAEGFGGSKMRKTKRNFLHYYWKKYMKYYDTRKKNTKKRNRKKSIKYYRVSGK
jgi:hypothetical protein